MKTWHDHDAQGDPDDNRHDNPHEDQADPQILMIIVQFPGASSGISLFARPGTWVGGITISPNRPVLNLRDDNDDYDDDNDDDDNGLLPPSPLAWA